MFDQLAAANPESRELDLDRALLTYFAGEAHAGLGALDVSASDLRAAVQLAALPENPAAIDREKIELTVRIDEQFARIGLMKNDTAGAAAAMRRALALSGRLPPWKVQRLQQEMADIGRAQSGQALHTDPAHWTHY